MKEAFDKYEDAELIFFVQQEEKKAFEAIYHRYARKLYWYTFSKVFIKETSEEIVQDIFTSLWNKRGSLIIIHSLSSYLYSAAKYRILKYIRSEEVRRRYAAHYTMFLADRSNNLTEEQLFRSDLEGFLEKRVSELPKKCQMAFRLSRYEYLPIPEIAVRMGISPRTVENHITHALRCLRSSLEKLPLVLVLLLILPRANL